MTGSPLGPSVHVWIDGHVVPADQAVVSVLDHGFTVGDGVYETIAVLDGLPFALRRHLARLRAGSARVGLDLGIDDATLVNAVSDVLAACAGTGTPPGRIRITVTSGPGPLGARRPDGPPTVVVAAGPTAPWPATAAVATVDWVRNERSPAAGVKATSYLADVLALRSALGRGADEAVMANTVGALCEGTGSNVWLVRDGALLTPSLATGCLSGVTRDLVLEMVEATESADLTLDDLRRADEAFLTSSTRGVHPIRAVDGRALPDPVPGPVTQRCMAALADLRSRTLDP